MYISATTCEGLVLHVFLYFKKANILNWAKPRPHSLGHAPHAIQTHIKCMFGKFDSNNVSKEIQQHVLRSISMDSCRVTKERKKNDKPIFWHFSLDHFFFQIHKAHFSPLEEYNKTKNSINGFYLASPLDDEIMNYNANLILKNVSFGS